MNQTKAQEYGGAISPFMMSRGLTCVLLAVSAAVIGCETTLDAPGKQLLSDAQQLYWAKRYPQAESKLTQFTEQYQNHYAVGEAHYLRGLTRLKQHRDDPATADFERAVRSPAPQVRGLANAALGSLAFERKEDAAVISYFTQSLADLDRAAPMDKVLHRLSVALQRQGRWDQAAAHLSKLMYWFADSDMVPDARRRYAARWFAIQVGAFSSAANAARQADRLRKDGYAVQEKLLLQNRRALHVVLVGKYPDYAAARSAQSRIARRVKPTRIVP